MGNQYGNRQDHNKQAPIKTRIAGKFTISAGLMKTCLRSRQPSAFSLQRTAKDKASLPALVETRRLALYAVSKS